MSSKAPQLSEYRSCNETSSVTAHNRYIKIVSDVISRSKTYEILNRYSVRRDL
jgi:hypothetical protein